MMVVKTELFIIYYKTKWDVLWSPWRAEHREQSLWQPAQWLWNLHIYLSVSVCVLTLAFLFRAISGIASSSRNILDRPKCVYSWLLPPTSVIIVSIICSHVLPSGQFGFVVSDVCPLMAFGDIADHIINRQTRHVHMDLHCIFATCHSMY